MKVIDLNLENSLDYQFEKVDTLVKINLEGIPVATFQVKKKGRNWKLEIFYSGLEKIYMYNLIDKETYKFAKRRFAEINRCNTGERVHQAINSYLQEFIDAGRKILSYQRPTAAERIQEVGKELKEIEEKLTALKALEYLENLWKSQNEKADKPLFILPLSYFVFHELVEYVNLKAQEYKDLYGEWPEWQEEAYRAAKIYQAYNNKN